MTELHRHTAKIVRPGIHGGQKPALTDQGEDRARIVPLRKVDRKKLLEKLRALGPIDLPSHK